MRLERGWTLRRMMLTHGFHLAHWQGFEKGKGISMPSLLRLCDVFDVTLEQLVAGLGVAIEGESLMDQKETAGAAVSDTEAPVSEPTPVRTPRAPRQRSQSPRSPSRAPKNRR